MIRAGSTIAGTLRWRAEHEPERRAFTFIGDDGVTETHLSCAELYQRAATVAAELVRRGAAGERVLLLYPAGEAYVVAIYGCLLAGAVAVPAYPPRKNRRSSRIESIVADAEPKLVLTTAARLDGLPGLVGIDPIATDHGLLGDSGDAVDLEIVEDAAAVAGSLAVLQYTSGSTGEPRGVMVTHGNLQHNMALIAHGFRITADDRGMLWLPSYHDMGLIGGVLAPPYVGIPVALMPPSVFLQRPLRWLAAVARHRATISGGPSFAYGLCVARTTEEERARLDLASWRVAFVGAEPVRRETLDRFTDAFAPSRFRHASFYPCYGLAEATLIVSGGHASGEPWTTGPSDAGRASVSCGPAMPDTTIAIVDPQSGHRCDDGRVGEIWVAGPSVARGYWNRPIDTEQVFRARLCDDPEAGPFLRTGDLGTLAGGELLVAGRLKDMFIINGRNHYAQDIEWTAEQSHDAVAGTAGAAFSVEIDDTERVVVVQEVKRSARRALAAGDVIAAIRTAIADEHEVPVHAIVLVEPLSIPKTSSGKTQRFACREAFLAGTLETIASWKAPEQRGAPEAPAAGVPAPLVQHQERRHFSASEIEGWLVAHIARVLAIDPAAIDVRQPFASHGLSSLQAVALSAELEDWLGRTLPATLAYDHPTIAALSHHLAGETRNADVGAGVHRADPESAGEPVAVIGMACRFPGAADLEGFWRLLANGVDAIGGVPEDRRALWEPFEQAAAFPRRAGFIGRVDEFDADFFGIAPREAASIDPQQRLLLEIAADALADAGLPHDAIRGTRTGVFVGISSSDYSRIRPDDPSHADPYAGTGNALSIAANRLSYVFDLHGPSLAVDTACSSALAAVHLACQSLQSGQCGVALAGGVNLLISPAVTASFAEMGFLSPEGRCKAFADGADGYVRGEGAGVVILKPLGRALADGDRVYAVIRGSAVNNDGRTNGLTAPSRQAQEAVLRDAYAAAGVSPGRAAYVEAHGTGTSLGDPIEMMALGAVLSEGRAPQQHCRVGSVKTNIGHLEAAAGIAGLIKTVLSLHRQEIPASLHFESPNPRIPFDVLPLRVQSATGAWPQQDGPRIAGVSSFGFGGTNAHVVLEQAPAVERPRADPAPESNGRAPASHLLLLSASSADRLQTLAGDFAEHLASTGQRWEDICHTASARRTQHDHRLAVVARSAHEARSLLDSVARGEPSPAVRSGRAAAGAEDRIAFVFTGQGAQWWGMGRELLEHDAAFRATIERCDAVLRRYADGSLIDVLRADEAASRLHETAIAQPAIVALEIALAASWQRWGVRPRAVVGHSVGEIAAAHVAGVLTLDDAVRIACHRGRVMRQAGGLGRMAAVRAPLSVVEAAIAEDGLAVSIAAVNSPTQVVLAGEPPAIEAILAAFRRGGVRCQELPGAYAFHSSQMAALADELAGALGDVRLGRPNVPILPTADGWSDGTPAFGAAYWPHQMRCTVRFAEAVRRLVDDGYRSFVEVGPHGVLCGAMAECLSAQGVEGLAVPTLRRGASDRDTMLGALSALYCAGCPANWRAVESPGMLVPLPKHPWRKRRFWIEQDPVRARARVPARAATNGAHPLLGARLDVAAASTFVWENEIDRRTHAFLADHRFQGGELVPGTAYFEMAVAAATELFGDTSLVLENIEFRAPLFLPRDGTRTSQVVLTLDGERAASFRVLSRPADTGADEPWTLHALGHVACDDEAGESSCVDDAERVTVQRRCTEELSGEDYFAELAGRGFEYGPAFRGLRRLWRRQGESLGRLDVPGSIAGEVRHYHLHPALLDAGAQLVVATDGEPNRPFLPAGVETVRVRRRAGADRRQPEWGHASYRRAMSNGTHGFVGDVRLLDRDGNLIVEARGLRVRYVDEGAQSPQSTPDRWLYELQWHRKPHVAQSHAPLHGGWLILADTGGIGEALARRITGAGGRPVLAFAGDAFEPLGGDRYRIRPTHAGDVRQLAERVRPTGIVHLWSVDAAPTGTLDASALATADRLGAGTVVALLQGFALDAAGQCAFWVATRGAHPVGDDESSIQVSQSPVWGLGRTLLQEHPALAGGLVDLDPTGAPEQVAAHLFGTIARPDGETQVALRGEDRFVARLVRPAALDGSVTVRFRADASYLISGGLGGLGLTVASWMVDCGARRLILAGRVQLPPRIEWTSLPSGSRSAESIAAVRALEARGASIHLASVDVSDEDGLDRFLTTFNQEGWPAIRGVVHAAGVVQDEVLSRVSPATLEAVSRAKVEGGWLLHRRFRDEPLDFFVLFSSAASLLGSAGQGAYAAANAFLDSLAHFRRSVGLPALAVNWGPWEQLGMAAKAEVGQRLARRGIGSIPPAQGLAVLGHLMRSPLAQAGVIPIDWNALTAAVPAARHAPLFELLHEASPTDGDDAPAGGARAQILAATESDRLAIAEQLVHAEVARVARLDAEALDPHRSLDLLGIDSLMSIELKNRLERSSGVSIPVVRMLEVPTVAGLAALLVEEVVNGSVAAAPAVPGSKGTAPAAIGSPLLALRELGTEPPLFLVHPGALDARCYSELADRLGDGVPCYVLQPPELENYRGLDAELSMDVSIESVAASCIEAMRVVQARGPYRLGGWSLGGVVAFDIAQQLEAQGDGVSLLALFDAPSPAAGDRPDDWEDTALVRLFASYLGAREGREISMAGDALADSADESFRRLRDHAVAAELVPADAEVEHVRSLYEAYKVGLRLGTQLLWRYRPRPYAGPITYFRAAEESAVLQEVFPAAASTWTGLTGASLEIHDVPGSHYTMFLPPHARTLAELLKQRL